MADLSVRARCVPGNALALPFPFSSIPEVGLLSGDPREIIADEIERLLCLLDRLDGDCDLEDSEAGLAHIDARGRPLPSLNVPPEHDEDREPDDDDQDGNGAEDDECAYFVTLGDGPGDALIDPGGEDTTADLMPEYDADQSAGPINECEASRLWTAAEHAEGWYRERGTIEMHLQRRH